MSKTNFKQIDADSVNAIRFLSVDAVEKANSGHPGLPLDAAPMAYVLWSKYLKQNPKDSHWINRDRFVLSAGHGSAMLYSLLHLSGFDLTIDDLKAFRSLGSRTPGHPEVTLTDGVDCTTGPLGQGLGMSVGMAMAERHMANIYNKSGFPLIDHYTYALAGDGDLMEGISHEAASLAGHLKLGKLIVLYDSNNISLDGPTANAFTESEKGRFEAYGWQYLRVNDGNNLDEISAAIAEAKAHTSQPTIIEVKTTIGYGTPKQGTNAVHGAPIGAEGVQYARKFYSWKYKPFEIPENIYENYKEKITNPGQTSEKKWDKLVNSYKEKYPELYDDFEQGVKGSNPKDLTNSFPVSKEGESVATRNTSHQIIDVVSKKNPNFWGGSADLFSSNKTNSDDTKNFEPGSYKGRNVWFGVREFGEAAAVNGIALHGGSKVYGSTFFVFSDYMRNAVRLAAIQQLPVTFVYTHDSVAVGEDGRTHEPIEQLMSFRNMPNVNVIRPADANETVAAWQFALNSKQTPTVLVLTRQAVPTLKGTAKNKFENVSKGGYVVSSQKGNQPDGILIATGSEVHLAVEAQKKLQSENVDVSVVSLPSFELFDAQDNAYKEKVLPKEVTKRLSIEMGSTLGWEHYIGLNGTSLGINSFGASGKGPEIIKHFGFTPENIVKKFHSLEGAKLKQ